MNARLTQLAAVGSTFVLVLGVAACSSDDARTGASASAASSSPSVAEPADATHAAFFQKIADAQTDVRTSHVSMRISAGSVAITADGDIQIGDTPADTSMSMTMDMGAAGPSELSMVLLDNVMYINLGERTGGKYGAVDLTDTSNPLGSQFATITDQLDPSKQLSGFKDALTSLEEKGEPVTIDGVEAQPYELTLDTAAMTGLPGTAGGSASGLPESLTYTMYIGPDNLLRRVTADVAGSAIQADYSKWGEPVEVEAPAADEISQTALDQLGGA